MLIAIVIGINEYQNGIANKIKPTKRDRLLLYFAGHGIARNSDTSPEGYLVPQDGDINHPETLLRMGDLHDWLSQLECRHLLVILDCCFAGTFRWASTRKLIPIPEEIHWEHYYRFRELDRKNHPMIRQHPIEISTNHISPRV